MTKSHIKLIMELIFIFILPLGIILASISCEKAMTYDENGNQLTEEKHIEYNNVILNEGSKNYINKFTINELVKNNNPDFKDTDGSGTNNKVDDWYSSGGQNTSGNVYYYSNGTRLNILMRNPLNDVYQSDCWLGQYIDGIIGHKYLINIVYSFNTSSIDSNGTISLYYPTLSNTNAATSLGTSLSRTQKHIFIDCTSRYGNKFGFVKGYSSTTPSINMFLYNLELIDLTEMCGEGFEPTTWEDYATLMNINTTNYLTDETQWLNYDKNGEEFTIQSSQQLSSNYELDLTIWGKLKNLIIDNLQLTDNIIIDIILSYTIIWFIMFIIWHFFYLFFDGLIHIFIDWGHKEKEKIK